MRLSHPVAYHPQPAFGYLLYRRPAVIEHRLLGDDLGFVNPHRRRRYAADERQGKRGGSKETTTACQTRILSKRRQVEFQLSKAPGRLHHTPMKKSQLLCAFCALILAVVPAFACEEVIVQDAPVGSLPFASIHEAGHVVAAKSVGFTVTGARVFQQFRGGIGFYWKGATSLRASKGAKGMAVVKLGGNFAEFFIDDSNIVRVPRFIDVVGNRNVISQSDVITRADLGADSLLDAQHKTYRALSGNVRLLDSVYHRLMTKLAYP